MVPHENRIQCFPRAVQLEAEFEIARLFAACSGKDGNYVIAAEGDSQQNVKSL